MAYYTAGPEEFASSQQGGLDTTPTTFGQALGATVAQGFEDMPTNRLAALGLHAAQSFGSSTPADELNRRYAIPGVLSFDKPMNDDAARDLYEEKHAQALRADTIAHGPQSLGAHVGEFFAGQIPQFLDPINVGAAFVPGLGDARVAVALGRAADAAAGYGAEGIARGFAGAADSTSALGEALSGTGAGRIAQGASQGIAGQAALEPLDYLMDKDDHEDWSMGQAITDLAFGGLMGGGFHALGHVEADAAGNVKTPAPEPTEAEPSDVPASIPQAADDAAASPHPSLIEQNEISNFSDAIAPHLSRLQSLAGEQTKIDADIARSQSKESDRFERESAKVTAARDQVSSLTQQRDQLANEAQSHRDDVSRSRDDTTPQRLEAIEEELGGPAVPASRRADLEAERQLINEGGGSSEQRALDRARSEAQAVALERRIKGIDKEISKHTKAADRNVTLRDGATDFRDRAQSVSQRVDDSHNMIEREVRRFGRSLGISLSPHEVGNIRSLLTEGGYPGDAGRLILMMPRDADAFGSRYHASYREALRSMTLDPLTLPEGSPRRVMAELRPDMRWSVLNEALSAASEGRDTIAHELALSGHPLVDASSNSRLNAAAQGAVMSPPAADRAAARDTQAAAASAPKVETSDGSLEEAQKALDEINARLGIGTPHSSIPEAAQPELDRIDEARHNDEGYANALEAAGACLARNL